MNMPIVKAFKMTTSRQVNLLIICCFAVTTIMIWVQSMRLVTRRKIWYQSDLTLILKDRNFETVLRGIKMASLHVIDSYLRSFCLIFRIYVSFLGIYNTFYMMRVYNA